jgi:hypothetical protein
VVREVRDVRDLALQPSLLQELRHHVLHVTQ